MRARSWPRDDTAVSMSRLTAVLGLTVCGACSPLVAVVGEEPSDASVDAAASAPAAKDAATIIESGVIQDSTTTDTSQPVEADDADAQSHAAPAPCLHFPDIIGPFQESGVTSVDGGVITVSLDQALDCAAPNAEAFSYRRNDGRPLLEPNHAYVWRWPTGGGATVTAYAANDWCETPALPF